ncbi:MAG: hypothetical protein JNM65_01980 [Verrucomicrobiaceae bacterium]|nr:hypothetical protein [Verrucomicrobiaceae bacterium]
MNATQKFTLFIDDNFHYMDESERTFGGVFDSYEAALLRAGEIVERSLQELFQPGMNAEMLYQHYVMFGEDPWILETSVGRLNFSAWNHAKDRCAQICASHRSA